MILAWARLVKEHEQDLSQILTLESGKPLAEARGEIAYGQSFLEWFGEEARRIYGDIIPAPNNDIRYLVVRQPVGVCGILTPWSK